MILFLFSCDEQENNYNQQINEKDDVITIDSLKINRKVLIIGIDGFRSDVTAYMFAKMRRGERIDYNS